MQIGSVIWSDEAKLRAAFSGMARVKMAPKFGSRSISDYQRLHCAALDVLRERLIGGQVCESHPEHAEVRVRKDRVQGKLMGEMEWRDLGLDTVQVWCLADWRTR